MRKLCHAAVNSFTSPSVASQDEYTRHLDNPNDTTFIDKSELDFDIDFGLNVGTDSSVAF